MDILSSQNKIISQLTDFLCEATDLFDNPRIILLLTSFTPHYTSSGSSADLFTKSIMVVIWQAGKFNSLLN